MLVFPLSLVSCFCEVFFVVSCSFMGMPPVAETAVKGGGASHPPMSPANSLPSPDAPPFRREAIATRIPT